VTFAQVAVAAGALVVVAGHALLAVRWTASERTCYASLTRPSWASAGPLLGIVHDDPRRRLLVPRGPGGPCPRVIMCALAASGEGRATE
jgi:hypothetical protein